jgi:heme oxygenase
MEQHNESKENTPTNDFLKDLRAATAPMHQGLEDNRISQSLMKPGVSLTEYAFYLRCMGEVIKTYDDLVLSAVSVVMPDFERRKKAKDIEADLEYLYANGAEILDAKEFKGFNGKPCLAYALGYAYVIEGSTLGGRVILKQVAPTLQLQDQGIKFFSGYGAETGLFWKTFLDGFTANVIGSNTQNEAIKGAIDAFSDIGRHFASHN